MKTLPSLVLSSLVAGALAAGCGCGGKTSTPTAPPAGGGGSGDGGGGAPPAKAGGPYMVAPVSNGGTISGTATWSGASVPVAASTKSTLPGEMRDAKEACDHPSNVVQELLVDAGSKGVANVVVFLKGISSGKALLAPATLDNKNCVFHPHVVIQPAGAAGLKISNSDPVGHNTHLFPKKNEDFNSKIDQGQAPLVWPKDQGEKLRAEGPVKVGCDLHSWMSGWIFVVDHPYYAVAGRDGKFSLTDVPPGSYELHAWHEWTGKDKQWPDGSRIQKSVTVAAGGTVTADLTLSDSGLAWK
ncbi:MAG: carboxypeptidase regulatory-like domain-containing protein [Planctomycetales bacterium]|nr:carboxypeptidase regulatory-like domain-containing protein [Planctomycetales bacterium]